MRNDKVVHTSTLELIQYMSVSLDEIRLSQQEPALLVFGRKQKQNWTDCQVSDDDFEQIEN
jgi:hypothetical protein